jgi:hypothetical protein
MAQLHGTEFLFLVVTSMHLSMSYIQILILIFRPNEVTLAPAAVFDGFEGILAAGGFVVPGHRKGGIFYSPKTPLTASSPALLTSADISLENWITLYESKDKYFFHRVLVMDVDGDGLPDLLSARYRKSLLFGKGKGELVYLTPENRANPRGAWNLHVIGPHCDVHKLFLPSDKTINSCLFYKHLILFGIDVL